MAERLTVYDEYAHIGRGGIAHKQCREKCTTGMTCATCSLEEDMLKRLAAYEDTGLTPEEIVSLAKGTLESATVDKDTKIFDLAVSHAFEKRYGITLDSMVELAEAEKEGRCVTLPCKVGDKVYVISGHGARSNPEIVERTVYSFYVEENGRVLLRLGAFDGCNSDELGKITGSPFWEGYYLTRAEAEKALGKEAQA